MINLKDPSQSYMFGFIHADGHLYKSTRNRGKLSIEISDIDSHILYEFQKIIPVKSTISTRMINTNFKDDYLSTRLTVCDYNYRTSLNNLGVPYGKKSDIIKPPSVNYSKVDYIRGLIDGDGSLGITSNKFPFLSFTTNNDYIAEFYLNFLEENLNKRKNNNRNNRDNIYNISIGREDAQIICDILYYKDCLCLERK